MPYNLKHLVHMPNTKQSEIHNSLASALFALFNSFFSFRNQWIDAIFLQPTVEVRTYWNVWVKRGHLRGLCGALGGQLVWGAQPEHRTRLSSWTPAVCVLTIKILLSEFWHYCTVSTYAFWAVLLKPHKSRFPLGTFYDKFPLLSQLLIVSVRKQLLEHRSRKHQFVGVSTWEREGEKVYLKILENII